MSDPQISGGRTWRIGPLSYTLGTLAILFGWLLFGDFAWNFRERAITPIAQLMLKGGGASDTLIGLLVASVPAGMGMLIAPIVGYCSDRFRSRWGRRIPFLLVSTPVAGLAILGLAFSPVGGRWLHDVLGRGSPAVCFLTVFGSCWVIFEIAVVVGNSLFLALINDVVPREVLGRFFGLFRAVSLGAGYLFNFYLLGKVENHFQGMLAGLAFIYVIGFGLMCLRVKEGPYPPVPVEEARENFTESLRRYGRECFTHRYYLWLFAALALSQAVFLPFNTFAIFYAKSLGMSMGDYGKATAVAFAISFAVSYLIGALADRVHPLRIAIGSLTIYLPLCLWGVFFIRTPAAFAFGFVAHVVVSGIFFTGTASIGQRLFPKSKFAQFASAAQLILGVFTILLPGIVGLALDYSGHAYRLTFLAAALLCGLALPTLGVVLRFYHELGGDGNYRPPSPEKELIDDITV